MRETNLRPQTVFEGLMIKERRQIPHEAEMCQTEQEIYLKMAKHPHETHTQ